MALNRRCSYSGGTHPNCDTCGGYVYSKSEHVHVFRRNPFREDCICGECFAITAVAAIPVFKAAEAIGLGVDHAALRDALDTGKIIVLAQTPLGFSLN